MTTIKYSTGLSIVLTMGKPPPIPKQEQDTPLGVYLRTVRTPPPKSIERPVIYSESLEAPLSNDIYLTYFW